MHQLISLFKNYTGKTNPEIETLPLSGSNRRYYRLKKDGISIIGVHGESKKENHAFIELSRHFYLQGLNTPQLYDVSSDGMFYIQQDLGDTLLFDYIEGGRKTGVFSAKEKEMLRKTIVRLAEFQIKGAQNLNFDICFPQADFDRRSVMWDLNYFKYNFLKTTGMDFSEDLLETEFEKMAEMLPNDEANTFLYRDFQSRNVMLINDEPYFIDYQGGRRGPVYYDVASFLWQAKANFSNELREDLVEAYIESLKNYREVDRELFIKKLRLFVLFRTLQVLGAYGFRGYFEKKPHFIQSIPYALNNLRELLEIGFDDFPYLTSMLREMVSLKQFDDTQQRELQVRVVSFAYKKGIPNDVSGNGGGYVFDCRAINNPGKYEHFSTVTGLDQEVIQFLEEDGEMEKFLDNIYPLVDNHIQRYLERKFTDLMVAFGCTGGQHRSVYAAQKMAEHITRNYGIKVSLTHREQNIQQEFRKR